MTAIILAATIAIAVCALLALGLVFALLREHVREGEGR